MKQTPNVLPIQLLCSYNLFLMQAKVTLSKLDHGCSKSRNSWEQKPKALEWPTSMVLKLEYASESAERLTDFWAPQLEYMIHQV